jgi:hypothetical protein
MANFVEDSFFNLATEVRKLQLGLQQNVDLGILKGALTRFEKALSKSTNIPSFLDTYYAEITKISFALRSPLLAKDSQIISCNDRIFRNKLGIGRRVPKPVTRIFEQFIKGITYFQHHVLSDSYTVIYHRLEACGTGDDAFRRLYQQCTDDMPSQRRSDVRKKIETCYIERLIYDRIYKEVALHSTNIGTEDHEQDQAHRERLNIVKSDFKTCFWNLDIDVDVKFDMHIPYEVTITRKLHDQVVSSETYTKTISFDPIFGGKILSDNVVAVKRTKQYVYTRLQSFTIQPNWARVGPTEQTVF